MPVKPDSTATAERSAISRLSLNIAAPFKGINREQRPWQIEDNEFVDVLNFFCYTNDLLARPEPRYTLLQPSVIGLRIRDLMGPIGGLQGPIGDLSGTAVPGPILGLLDGYTESAVRSFAAITDTYVFAFFAGSWTPLAGTLAGVGRLFSTTSLLGRLLFSQGVNKIQSWDGTSPNFGDLSPNAPAAKFLTTYADRVIAVHTTESGTTFYQRVRWSRDGDPTDWISFGSGFLDLLSGNDPATGVTVVNNRLVVFFPQRIEIGSRTFDSNQPFRFDTFQKSGEGSAIGNVCPYALATWGNICCFISREDVYSFDGQMLQRIGGKCQKAILADIRQGDHERVFGKITDLSAAKDHLMYWICCPNGAIWIFDFSTQAWLRVKFSSRILNVIGRINIGGQVRIIDLIGSIAEQNWLIGSLTATTTFDDILLGFSTAELGILDYTLPIATEWKLISKEYDYDAPDWNKTLKRIKVKYTDNGRGLVTLKVKNELNRDLTIKRWLGTTSASGRVLYAKFDFTISGERLSYEMSGAFPISISQISHEGFHRGPVLTAQGSQSKTP